MKKYLSYTLNDNEDFIETFDELPLWSASFGLLLLKHLQPGKNLIILDIGSGAGFPLMEIAGRFGSTCKCYGLDVWTNANNRAKKKIKNYDLDNVEVIEGSADKIPFGDNSIDLIVSNLGINNFENPAIVFDECYRVLKPGGRLALTTNINGHWKEFYTVFESTLQQLGKEDILPQLQKQQEHRGDIQTISALFTNSNLNPHRHYTESFEMKFADGSAMLNHYFVKLGWLSSWKEIITQQEQEDVFTALENNLNAAATQAGSLILTVPMLYMEGVKA